MIFSIEQLLIEQARSISSWQYDPPFSIYNLSPEEISLFSEPANRYYAILNEFEELIGYCCFGGEARVAGGIYQQLEPLILDVGVGMRPDKTGIGLGNRFVDRVLQFGKVHFSPMKFRATIAAFNQRSLKTFYQLGFDESYKFKRPKDGLEFIQLERTALGIDRAE